MNAFISKILGFLLSIITTVSLTFAPVTETVVKSNYKIAKSFDPIVYENQLKPELDEDGSWTFTTDGSFKIVQLTDVHIGGGSLSIGKDKKAMNAVAAMLTYEKPDLVVLTGDMAYPVAFQGGSSNNEISTKMLITLLETLGVYYAPVFGNHDSEAYSTHTREEIGDIWGADDLKYSLFQKGPEDVDGVGNYVIKIKGTDGRVNNALYLIDSNEYTEDDALGLLGNYDTIHDNQIEWYKASVQAIDEKNNDGDAIFTSYAFFHIPLEEYKTAWQEYAENGYNDTENVKLISGGYHEPDENVCCSDNSDLFFETVLELGSTKGIFVGHDHVNNSVLNYKGVDLVYGMSIDYLAYPDLVFKGAQRGCTVINLGADGTHSVSLENYYQDKYESKYDKECVTMQW